MDYITLPNGFIIQDLNLIAKGIYKRLSFLGIVAHIDGGFEVAIEGRMGAVFNHGFAVPDAALDVVFGKYAQLQGFFARDIAYTHPGAEIERREGIAEGGDPGPDGIVLEGDHAAMIEASGKMFFETVERAGKTMKRFELVEDPE